MQPSFDAGTCTVHDLDARTHAREHAEVEHPFVLEGCARDRSQHAALTADEMSRLLDCRRCRTKSAVSSNGAGRLSSVEEVDRRNSGHRGRKPRRIHGPRHGAHSRSTRQSPGVNRWIAVAARRTFAWPVRSALRRSCRYTKFERLGQGARHVFAHSDAPVRSGNGFKPPIVAGTGAAAARIELLSSGTGVTETALQLGYGSVSAFSFPIRTEMGLSPRGELEAIYTTSTCFGRCALAMAIAVLHLQSSAFRSAAAPFEPRLRSSSCLFRTDLPWAR